MKKYFGPLTFDSSLRQVTCDGCEIHLTPKAFDLLTLLLANAGRVVTKQEVHAALWPDTFVSEATLVGLVKMLRRTLGDHWPTPIIRTMHGVGYALVTPIESGPSRSEGRRGIHLASRSLSADGNEDLIGCNPTGSIDSHAGRGLHQRRGIADHRVTLANDRAVVTEIPRDVRQDNNHIEPVSKPHSVATPHSVAVLPFTDLSPQQDQAYLGEGIAEELIHALSAIAGLRVSARSSSFRFAGKAVNIRGVGAQLGVETILEGSIRTADHRLRLTARLVDVNNECQLWSERYDCTLGNIFAVQDEISRAIVGRLQVTARSEHGHSSSHRHSEDLEAYNLYLQGRYYWSRRPKGALQLATACFERAIARDPSYALAYAGLADVYTTLGLYGGLPARVAVSKARPSAQHAILLNDALSEAHHSNACIQAFLDWDFIEAEREFLRAITLRPSSGLTHSTFAYLLAVLGRFEESSHEAARALALEPMSPLVRVHVATTLFLARQFEEGLIQCERALEIDPSFALAHWARCIVLTVSGRYNDALEVVNCALNSSWDFLPVAAGWLYTVAGQHDKADEILVPLGSRSPSECRFSLVFAWIALARGEIDRAFEWLDRAYDDRNPQLLQIGVARLYDPLRADSRFAALLKKVGLNGVVPAAYSVDTGASRMGMAPVPRFRNSTTVNT